MRAHFEEIITHSAWRSKTNSARNLATRPEPKPAWVKKRIEPPPETDDPFEPAKYTDVIVFFIPLNSLD